MGTSASVTTVVVTGGYGRLGTALQGVLPSAIFLSRQSLDVSNAIACRTVLDALHPTTIIHLAAETRHNAPWGSYVANNILATAFVAQWAQKHAARLVYTSTDYVYPGTHGGYPECSAILPINAYARSKYAAECVVAGVEGSLTIRGSWYNAYSVERAATDAFTSRVPVQWAAACLGTLVGSAIAGVLNLGGTRRSLYEIALEGNQRVVPCSRYNLDVGYEIPYDVSLDTTRARSLGIR